jgi:hypothetical protein
MRSIARMMQWAVLQGWDAVRRNDKMWWTVFQGWYAVSVLYGWQAVRINNNMWWLVLEGWCSEQYYKDEMQWSVLQ